MVVISWLDFIMDRVEELEEGLKRLDHETNRKRAQAENT
jgi:hypothetical protein